MHLADALQMQVCKEFVWQKNILTKLAKWIPLWFRVVRKQNLKHSKGVNILLAMYRLQNKAYHIPQKQFIQWKYLHSFQTFGSLQKYLVIVMY